MKRLAVLLLTWVAGAVYAAGTGPPVVVYLDSAPDEATFRKFAGLFDARVRPRFPGAIVERRMAASEDLEMAQRSVAAALRAGGSVAVTADAYLARAVSEGGFGIPLVFATLAEPVTMGIVDDPISPRRDVTGFTLHVPFELKHIELVKEFAPGIRRVGVLADADWAAEPIPQRLLREAPALFGVTVELFDATGPEAMSRAIGRGRDIDAWYVPDTAPNRVHARAIAEAMAAARKPSIGGHASHVAGGGLMAYAPARTDPWPRLVEMVGLVLSGIPAREIPIERPRRFELVMSAAAVKRLGGAVPRPLLLKVDELAR